MTMLWSLVAQTLPVLLLYKDGGEKGSGLLQVNHASTGAVWGQGHPCPPCMHATTLYALYTNLHASMYAHSGCLRSIKHVSYNMK